MAEKDTVGDKYYRSVTVSNTLGGFAFIVGIPISIVIFFKDSLLIASAIGAEYAALLGDIFQSLFLVITVFLFFQGMSHRLYFLPRAEDARRANILTDGFGVPISDDETIGYYNNSLSEPAPRLAANCMESAFFTKELTRRMLVRSRWFSSIYLLGYIFLLATRSVDLAVVDLLAGFVFSEFVLARWFRLEFLHRRSEVVYEKFRELFAWNLVTRDDLWVARAINTFTLYEASKSIAAVSIPSSLFSKMNPSLSGEWEAIRVKLGV